MYSFGMLGSCLLKMFFRAMSLQGAALHLSSRLLKDVRERETACPDVFSRARGPCQPRLSGAVILPLLLLPDGICA